MAAVLCEADTKNADYYTQGDERADPFYGADAIPIVDLIRAADRKELEELLVKFAYEDEKTESHIRAALTGASVPVDISEMVKEIDSIFCTYSGRGGFIDYHAAMEFEQDLTTYLKNKTVRLVDEKDYYAAFEIAKYAYVKLGNWDIDDDGEITAISGCCYEIWQNAARNCSDSEKARIKE